MTRQARVAVPTEQRTKTKPVRARQRDRPFAHWGLALLVIAIGGFLLAACGSEGSEVETAQQTDTDGYRGMAMGIPLVKPVFTLPDTSGSPFDFTDETEGYVTLLFFGYTYCPDICPLHLARVADALKELPEDVASRVKLVFVTADPLRDTPARLREFLDVFDSAFVGLIPEDQAATDGISRKALRTFWAPIMNEDLGDGNYAVAHPAVIVAYTTDNLAHILYPFGVTTETWVHDLAKLVKEGWTE